MQIHEITTATQVTEGVFDTIKSGIAGAKQGYRLNQTNRATQAIADKAYPIWKDYAKRLEQSITDPVAKQAFANRTDGLYQKALTAFVQKNFLKNIGLNTAINKDQIIKIIQQLSQPTNVKATPAPAATTPVPPAQVATPKATPSTIIDPATNKPFTSKISEALDTNTEKQLFTQLVQTTSLAQPDTEKQQNLQGQLVSNDPAIVRFDGRTYGLNDNGEWADIKNNRNPDQSVVAYLDKIAGTT